MGAALPESVSLDVGAWVTQSDNHIDTIHATEIEALRAVNRQGYGGPVVFVQWGESLVDAERREREAI